MSRPRLGLRQRLLLTDPVLIAIEIAVRIHNAVDDRVRGRVCTICAQRYHQLLAHVAVDHAGDPR